MYSVNSVSLVSSFQNLIQNGFYSQDYSQEIQPRPIRKSSPTQHSPESSQINSQIIYAESQSSTPTSSINQFESNKCKYKLRSESLSIDFNQYKQTVHTTKYTACSFCKNNGEPEHVYMSHPFKDTKGVIICPILKNYQCPMCGESGEKAHTITYCKQYKNVKRNRILNNIN